jgi:hypothetical protein
LSFGPKKEEEEGFDLVAITFTIEVGRNTLTEMIILDKLPFMFVENFEDEGYNTHFHKQQTSGGMRSLDASDFYDCRLFVNFLKLFYNVKKKFSGSLYVTSNTIFIRYMSFKPKLMS